MDEKEQEAEFKALDIEYQKYIGELKAKWHREHPLHSRNVIEVWSEHEREQANHHIADYKYYITPIIEAWWKERGWGVIWPDDDSKPMQCYKFEEV